MKFLIITNAIHGNKEKLFSYGPYVREMNLWIKYADEVVVIAPFELSEKSAIDIDYIHSNIIASKIPSINFQNFPNIISSLFNLPIIFFQICNGMRSADHIHLRCPGNIGLIGCFAQILFPSKQKTVKYAGNWDPKSKQPLSYKVQRWILSNTFLSRNMQVLVYGDWPNQTKNIKAFFTASYSESDKVIFPHKKLEGKIRFLFVGTLSEGKRPLYALKLVEGLYRKGVDVQIDFYGEGVTRKDLENYIESSGLASIAKLYGNQAEDIIRMAYKNSHFLVLPSKSEGWPKAVAEAMFWGVVPAASEISCLAFMLDYGRQGILLKMDLEIDIEQIFKLLDNQDLYFFMSKKAEKWSRQYTINKFENDLKLLLN